MKGTKRRKLNRKKTTTKNQKKQKKQDNILKLWNLQWNLDSRIHRPRTRVILKVNQSEKW